MIGPNLKHSMHSRHEFPEREAQGEVTQAHFDRHLPEAGDTEQSFIRTVLDELTCVEAEGRVTVNKPEQGVCIE